MESLFRSSQSQRPRFEDTRAGNGALAFMVAAALVICAIRFGLVALTGKAW